MIVKDDGGPAFPTFNTPVFGGSPFPSGGMTLRQYAAIQIMAGLVADPAWDTYSRAEVAEQAVRNADALLEALK
jgi:hypothetical protein